MQKDDSNTSTQHMLICAIIDKLTGMPLGGSLFIAPNVPAAVRAFEQIASAPSGEAIQRRPEDYELVSLGDFHLSVGHLRTDGDRVISLSIHYHITGDQSTTGTIMTGTQWMSRALEKQDDKIRTATERQRQLTLNKEA